MGSSLDRLAELVEGSAVRVDLGRRWLHVPAARWVAAGAAARDEPGVAAGFFDYLTAVDEQPAGFAVLAHLYSPARREHVALRTRLERDHPELDTWTGLFPGAAWHERETWEMYGIAFRGHPALRTLLLDEGFEGHPLRKDTLLASRAVKPWPGAVEPGAGRRPARAPGQPPPGAGWPAPDAR